MADGMYRIGVVGASSLLGKELADELNESLLAASDFVLLEDEEDVSGAGSAQIAAVGDEAAVIQGIEADSFARMDFVFFAGDAAGTAKHWVAARKSGASIVDMSYALEGESGVTVRSPLVRMAMKAGPDGALGLETPAVVAAHPAAVMLGLVLARLQTAMPVASVAATVFEPASQHGREAMDELHQQTVKLLSFQDLPKEHYDAQVAFNIMPALGDDAKVQLAAAGERILRHYQAVGGGVLPPLDVMVVQAPVFHGYVASVLVEAEAATTVWELERALEGEGIDVVAEDSDPPSNLSAAGQEDVMVRVRSARGAEETSRRFWVWVAADNLKLGALNAIACANELRRYRPRGKVQ